MKGFRAPMGSVPRPVMGSAPGRARRLRRVMAALLGPVLAASVCAIGASPVTGPWTFVDGAGVVHLAPRPLDARYQPLLGAHSAPGTAPTRRVAGKADSAASLLTWLDIAPEVRVLRPWLREAAVAHGVDATLLKAVIAVESGFDPSAVSPRGALGLMQIMPASAERYATEAERERPVDERLRDPRTNIHIGARMLADLQRRFGRIDIALAAWNAGEGRVRRAGDALPAIAETEAHVQLVLEIYWALLQRDHARRAHRFQIAPGP